MIETDVYELAETLGHELLRARLVLSCAESCTGGLVAAAVTEVAGSSAWFDRGFVTYSNQAKQDHLGVSEQTLQRHGAVSIETAGEMACGVLRVSSLAGVAVSTTGIAGPSGATPGKPVGMVCFGLAWRQRQAIESLTFTRHLKGERAQVRSQAVSIALTAVLDHLRLHTGHA